MTVAKPPLTVTLAHCAAGVNAVNGALDWGGVGLLSSEEGSSNPSGLPSYDDDDAPLAYASAASILLFDQGAGRVVAALHGHTGRVNCVAWRRGGAGGGSTAELASAGADGCVRVWQVARPPARPTPPSARPPRLAWECSAVLSGAHATPITALAWFTHPGSGEDTLVSLAGEGGVWVRRAGGPPAAWALAQTLPFGPRLRHAAALAAVPGSPSADTLLALGGVDGCIELLVRKGGGGGGGGAAPFARAAVARGGHTDWVRCLRFRRPEGGGGAGGDGTLLLASASNDRTAAVWTVRAARPAGGAGAAAREEDGEAVITRLARGAPGDAASTSSPLSIDLAAVLGGHDDWVHAVDWRPAQAAAAGGRREGGGEGGSTPELMTASMDRSVRFWRRVPSLSAGSAGGADADAGLWMCEARAGDAGAAAVGWSGGCFSPGGTAAAAHGPAGAVHVWRAPSPSPSSPDGGLWRADRSAGGHTRAITDLAWAGDGGCVLTVSADQTARLSTTTTTTTGGNGRGGGDGGDGAAASSASAWCEVARPQVHGHDFYAVAALPPPRLAYAAASEEKVVRVLGAPGAFVETLALARGEGGADVAAAAAGMPGMAAAVGECEDAYGAAAPALGLSNRPLAKGVATGGGGGGGGNGDAAFYNDGPDAAPTATPAAVAGRPLEAHLAAGTLWPETVKLYGHAAEVVALAAHPSGRWLASAARGSGARWCAVWVWDTRAWAATPGGPWEAHTAAIARLTWSPCGAWLLSVGKDRAWAVHEVVVHGEGEGEGGGGGGGGEASPPPPALTLRALRPAAHSRQLYDAAWAPADESGKPCARFATGARDGSVRVWAVVRGEGVAAAAPPLLDLPPFPAPVTALAYAPVRLGGVGVSSDLLAVGLETGALELWRVEEGRAERVWAAPAADAPGAAVRRLAWRTVGVSGAPSSPLLLAAGGDDHALRVYEVVVAMAAGGR